MKQDKLTGLMYYDDFKETAPEIIRGLTRPVCWPAGFIRTGLWR